MATEYWKKSYVTGKKYNYFGDDIIRLVNLSQCMAYISNGAELLDIYTSRNRATDDPMLIFVFSKNSTRELYSKWCNHELEIRDQTNSGEGKDE